MSTAGPLPEPPRTDPGTTDPGSTDRGTSGPGTTGPDPTTLRGDTMDDTTVAPVPTHATEPLAAPPRGPAVGTLVWGVVILALGLLIGVREVTDVRIDYGLLLPVGLLATGALLVLGALVTALRSSTRGTRRT